MWEKEELKKEQIRGVFAIGVLATLFGYQTVKNLLPSSIISGALINLVTIFLGVFWGIYIICIAFSMIIWEPSGKVESILKWFKHFAGMMFYFGSVFTLTLAVPFGIILVIESIKQNLNSWLLTFISLIIALAIIGIGAFAKKIRKK